MIERQWGNGQAATTYRNKRCQGGRKIKDAGMAEEISAAGRVVRAIDGNRLFCLAPSHGEETLDMVDMIMGEQDGIEGITLNLLSKVANPGVDQEPAARRCKHGATWTATRLRHGPCGRADVAMAVVDRNTGTVAGSKKGEKHGYPPSGNGWWCEQHMRI